MLQCNKCHHIHNILHTYTITLIPGHTYIYSQYTSVDVYISKCVCVCSRPGVNNLSEPVAGIRLSMLHSHMLPLGHIGAFL